MTDTNVFIKSGGIIKVSHKVYVSIFSFAALILFCLSQKSVYTLLFLSSALFHELSHLVFLSLFGAKVTRITIFPFGIDINADTSRINYKKELVCTLAGSMANLTVCLILYPFLCRFPSPPLLFFMLCNLFLGILNLIPLSFFDGGKALRLILYDRLDIDKAYYFHRAIDTVSAFVFLCFSLFLIKGSNFNFSVCAVVIYASISTLALYRNRPI